MVKRLIKRRLSAGLILMLQFLGPLRAEGCLGHPLSFAGTVWDARESLAQQPQLVVERGHLSWISSVSFARNDTDLVTGGGGDDTAILWDLASGKEIRRFRGHTAQILCVAINPIKPQLLTAGVDKTVRLWDLATGRQIRIYRGHRDTIVAAAFAENGKRFFTIGKDGTLRIWDIRRSRPSRTFTEGLKGLDSAAFSENGLKLVVKYKDKTARVFDSGSGRLIVPLEAEIQAEYPDAITKPVIVSRDGSLAAVLDNHYESRIYDLQSGKVLWRIPHDFEVDADAVAFDRDAKRLIVAVTGPKENPAYKSIGNAFSASRKVTEAWQRSNLKASVRVFDAHTGSEFAPFSIDVFYAAAITFNTDSTVAAIASLDASTHLFRIPTGEKIEDLEGNDNEVKAIAVSPDSQMIAVADKGDALLKWDISAGSIVTTFGPNPVVPFRLRFNEDGKSLISEDDDAIHIWNVKDHLVKTITRNQNPHGSTLAVRLDGQWAFSMTRKKEDYSSVYGALTDLNDNSLVRDFLVPDFKANALENPLWPAIFAGDGISVFGIHEDRVTKLDVSQGRELWLTPMEKDSISDLVVSKDSSMVATASLDHTAKLWDGRTGKLEKDFVGHRWVVNAVALSADGKFALTGSGDETARLWSTKGFWRRARAQRILTGHIGDVTAVSFFSSSDVLATGGMDGTIRLWRRSDGSQICTLMGTGPDQWSVFAPDGRFDTSDLDEIKGLHWVFADDPYHPLPPEIYLRDYFEPKLLPRLLFGKKDEFRPIRPLESLNRAVPVLSPVRLIPDTDNGTVSAEVDVEGGSYPARNDVTGAFDFHLFRDGQLVRQYPEPKETTPDGVSAPELAVWQTDKHVVDFGSKKTLRFAGIKLPHGDPNQLVRFTAYAFNQDRVKSGVAAGAAPPLSGSPAKKAYLLTIGVNNYSSPGWNLQFAAKDAEKTAEILGAQLKRAGYFLTTTTLVSDDKHDDATADKIRESLKSIATQATPDDLVVVSFSGHGYSGQSSAFYLLPSESKPSEINWSNPTSEELRRLISASNLANWFRSIEASEIVLIIDACHSAGGIEENGFRPGPLGSRGLGQLAYDKRMRVLAASQENGTALEIGGSIQEGILTYVLLHDGIQAHKALDSGGQLTVRSWLEYPVRRVPELFNDLRSGKFTDFGVPVERDATLRINSSAPTGVVQVPALFDFKKDAGLSMSTSTQ